MVILHHAYIQLWVVYRQQLKLTLGAVPDQIFQLDETGPFLPEEKDVFPLFPTREVQREICQKIRQISPLKGG